LERQYLTIFIIVLLASVIAGVSSNAFLDIKNRGQVNAAIQETFDIVKANKAEDYANIIKLQTSLIYEDYEPAQLARKIKDATDLYVFMSGMKSLTSTDIVKILDRSVCLAATTFEGAEQKEVTRHIILIKYENRSGDKKWLPMRLVNVEIKRTKTLENLEKMLDAGIAAEQARKQAENAIASPVNSVEGKISQILSTMELSADKRANLAGKLREIVGKIEDSELAEQVKSILEKAVKDGQEPASKIIKAINTPKSRYLRFIAQLKIVSEDPEKGLQRINDSKSALSKGNLSNLANAWSMTEKSHLERYIKAVGELVKMAPKGKLKEDAQTLEKGAQEAAKSKKENPELPDLKVIAGKIREELLKPERIRQEQFEEFLKLARKSLTRPETRKELVDLLTKASEKPDSRPEKFIDKYAELISMPEELVQPVEEMLPSMVSNEATLAVWLDWLKGGTTANKLKMLVEYIKGDSLDLNDLYEARVGELNSVFQGEKNRSGTVKAKMRKNAALFIDACINSWSAMKGPDEYLKWAFPEGMPTAQSSGLSEAKVKRLVEHQKNFGNLVAGKKVVASITHHWYPDPEGFSWSATGRQSLVLRVKFQINPGVEKGKEEYEVNDFMVLLRMKPDWNVSWGLYRMCDLYEYAKCREIAEIEMKKRSAYFADGKAR